MRRASDTTATALAYREIKNRILDSRYQAGEKLSEVRLCRELGLGRSPIRTALARLKEEGWIAVSPQSGTYVKSLSAKDIEEVIELRLLLEMHVAATAARQIEDDELRRLQQVLGTLAPRIVKGELEAFMELDDEIHSAIYEAAGNQLIAGLLQTLREKVRWILPATATALERRYALRELERIVDALKKRNPETAAQRMREHVGDAAALYKKVGNVPPNRRRARDVADGAASRPPAASKAGRR
jgi:DNA-binding GntR family transcriptional regulator